MKNTWIIIVITAVVVGGAAFFGGTKYAQGKSTTTPGAANFNRGRGFGGNTATPGTGRGVSGAGGFIAGDVLSKDDKTITIKLRDGSGSKIIFFSSSTPVRKTSQGSLEDVTIGSSVTVVGQTGSDGSIVANSIQLGDVGMIRIPGGQGGQRQQ